jgi:hypothetical protein
MRQLAALNNEPLLATKEFRHRVTNYPQSDKRITDPALALYSILAKVSQSRFNSKYFFTILLNRKSPARGQVVKK